MSLLSTLLIALGLSMDAFAVSITSGIAIKKMRLRHAMLIAGFFGSFQAIMPLLGWSLGLTIKAYVEAFDHWLAFITLTAIGCKMIYEATRFEEEEKVSNPLEIYVLFILAIATSIDALAVGFTMSFLNVSIMLPVIIIGTVTFLLSFAGTYIGNTWNHLFETKIEIAGGVILIAIGFKILLQHLFF